MTNTVDETTSEARHPTPSGSNEFVFDQYGKRVSVWVAPSQTLQSTLVYWDGKPLLIRANGATHFEHADWVGTVRMRTGPTGAVGSGFSSLAFGDGYAATGDQEYAWGHFAGTEYDYESNTSHAQFRQYSSTQGRWMSPDPYDGSYQPGNPQSFNRYSYVLNNPVSHTDALGLDDVATLDPGDGGLGDGGGWSDSGWGYGGWGYGGGGGEGGEGPSPCPADACVTAPDPCPVDACVTGNPDPPAPTEPSVPGPIDPAPTPPPFQPCGDFRHGGLRASFCAPQPPTTNDPPGPQKPAPQMDCNLDGCFAPLPTPTCGALKKAAAGAALVAATARVATLAPPAAPVAGPTSIGTGFVAAVLSFLSTFQIGCTP